MGRWLIIPAAAIGGVLGTLTTVHEAVLAGATAFICGGVVLNVLKEELPSEAESRFGAFATGVVAYSALLLALG